MPSNYICFGDNKCDQISTGIGETFPAAAQTMVEQARQVSQTMQETHPDDKNEIADTLRQGLEAYRGALAEIAEQYGAAMKNTAELNQLVEQMRKKIDQWASQTIEAKCGSMIENVEMRIKGSGGKQEVRAEDDSSISGVKQIIE
jgi:ATPase subunit of ABC transporter with duplicated ATPase domains